MKSSVNIAPEADTISDSRLLERPRILPFSRKVDRGHLKELLIEKFLLLNGLASILIIVLIFLFLFREGVNAAMAIPWSDFIGHYGEDAITGQRVFKYMWQPVAEP